jgi:hypothetical protein
MEHHLVAAPKVEITPVDGLAHVSVQRAFDHLRVCLSILSPGKRLGGASPCSGVKRTSALLNAIITSCAAPNRPHAQIPCCIMQHPCFYLLGRATITITAAHQAHRLHSGPAVTPPSPPPPRYHQRRVVSHQTPDGMLPYCVTQDPTETRIESAAKLSSPLTQTDRPSCPGPSVP